MTQPAIVWLVPLLPIFGFVFQIFIGRRLPKPIVSVVSCAVVLASCILSWMLFLDVRKSGIPIVANLGPWIRIGGFSGALSVIADHKLMVDQLTCVMILVITNIGFLIHVYSIGYMAEEKRYARYFAYLNLFTGFMLILVMASNLLLMFVGWEGVGLCSYLLIGFWYEKKENAIAGMKAFLVNRVGDVAFMIGALLLFVTLGREFGVWTVDFEEMKRVITANTLPVGLATVVGILLFIGAAGKSAQVPLYVWLPDAMAGPTPVSALIHAATMVTAGVYMIARMNFLFSLSPTAMAVVATVGAVTALFAGTIGFAQNDIKKVLAYSTVSQLGFMFMGVGVGAYSAGVFHLFTHAFFKACLFLGAGSVIHGMGGEQDMRKMGGLRTKMPWTFWTFALASIAIAGIPPFAGFFSKDEILWRTWDTHAFPNGWGKVLWLMGAAAAAGTAFYMTRLVVMTFLGQKHEAHDDAGHGHHEPHESPWSMRIALVLLATGSVFTGFLGVPPALKGGDEFGAWLVPVVGGGAHGPAHAIEYILMLASVLLAVGGVALAFHVYGVRKGVPAREFAEKNKELYELVRDKYRVDEFYDKAVIGPLLDLNEGTCRFDNEVVDGMVNGSAWVGRTVARGAGIADNEVVDAGVNAAAEATQVLGGKIRRIQTGNIKQYLTFALVGGLFVIAFFCVVLTWDRITQIFM